MKVFAKYLVLGSLFALPFVALAPKAFGFDDTPIEDYPVPNCCGAYCSSSTNNGQCRNACTTHCNNSTAEFNKCDEYCSNAHP